MTAITIGKQIAFLRSQAGLSQESLANKLSVSNQAVSKWETGQCCPDISLLPRLAEIFDVSVDELLGYKPPCKAEDALLSLRRTAHSLPEDERYLFVLRSAAALHQVVLENYMPSRKEVSPAGEKRDTWGYSCVDAPAIVTVMRRGGVFFSNNRDLALSSADFSKIVELLKRFTDNKAFRAAVALYELTSSAEELYVSALQVSEAANLSEEAVTACLQDVLSPLLKEKREEGATLFRFDGPYQHTIPLLSLLGSVG